MKPSRTLPSGDCDGIWRKSPYCSNVTCVEICEGDTKVLIRDGKQNLQSNQPIISLSVLQWSESRRNMKRGVFGEVDKSGFVVEKKSDGTVSMNQGDVRLIFNWDEWDVFHRAVVDDLL